MTNVIVVSGATGLLGRSLVPLLKKKLAGCEIIGLGFSRCLGDIRRCDLTKPEDVDSLFRDLRPKFFVHCAAERRPDIVESGNPSVKAVNVTATEMLAEKCREFDCTLIFISSDYVFDGTKPPYAEHDPPNPLNLYGSQKFDGEKVVQAAHQRNVVVRMPVLYGPLDKFSGLDESAITVLFKAVKNPSIHAKLDDVAVRFPTYTCDVAEVLCNIMKELIRGNSSICGIFHLSADEPFTKYEMACQMALLFDLPSSHLAPDMASPAKVNASRPLNAKLSCKRAKDLNLLVKMTPFAEGIKNCLLPYI